jgi:hypothetical protein
VHLPLAFVLRQLPAFGRQQVADLFQHPLQQARGLHADAGRDIALRQQDGSTLRRALQFGDLHQLRILGRAHFIVEENLYVIEQVLQSDARAIGCQEVWRRRLLQAVAPAFYRGGGAQSRRFGRGDVGLFPLHLLQSEIDAEGPSARVHRLLESAR